MVVGASVATGCGSNPSPAATTTADLPTDQDSPGVEAEYDQAPRPARTELAQAIVLDGIKIGVRLRATVTGVLDPARGVSRRPVPIGATSASS